MSRQNRLSYKHRWSYHRFDIPRTLKGVNLARTLINQIDAPVGQVKIAIHTVQVNGEHGKRMEPVVGRIQRYIDHSRFLTTQSGQMLRNAVTLVASRRADQAMALCEGMSQHERDQKYIEAFFGREFLAELRTLDSEFLHTGNKLLSLHSMDSTSLANALFLLSLAKNDVRQEILVHFEQMVSGQLPQDEMEYFTASTEKYKFGPPFHKQKFQFMAQNAKFVSLRGFFNADVAGSDTLTPMQREFIRLQGDLPSPVNPPAGCYFHPRCPQAMPVCATTYPERTPLSATRAVNCHLYRTDAGAK